MSKLSDFKNPHGAPGRPCSVCTGLLHLRAEDAELYEDIQSVFDGTSSNASGVSATQLRAAFASCGVNVSAYSISHHRRGDCSGRADEKVAAEYAAAAAKSEA